MKNKPLLSLGRRNYEVLRFLSDNKRHRFKELDRALNLNGNGVFYKQLLEMGLIDRVGYGMYKINKTGLYFVKLLENKYAKGN